MALRILAFIDLLIGMYVWVIIAGAVLSWLIAFNVLNSRNGFVQSLWQAIGAVTEPLLRPIRRLLPHLGGVDLSPLVLILACWFVQRVILPSIADLVR